MYWEVSHRVSYHSDLLWIDIMRHYLYLVQWDRHVSNICQRLVIDVESIAHVPSCKLLGVGYWGGWLMFFIYETETAVFNGLWMFMTEWYLMIQIISMAILLCINVGLAKLMSSPKSHWILRCHCHFFGRCDPILASTMCPPLNNWTLLISTGLSCWWPWGLDLNLATFL